MKFQKSHGLGNDFIIINGFPEKTLDYSAAASLLCHRRKGIGADGLIILLPSECADFRMRVFNSDGSEAEMCGNGIRCLGKYIFDNKFTDSKEITVETPAGIKTLKFLQDKKGSVSFIWVNMGQPVFEREQIPLALSGKAPVIDEKLLINGREISINCLSTGNPHCVLFLKDNEDLPVEVFGPLIENNVLFPKKINVEFVRILSRNRLAVEVWERGAGITDACGTGACAALVMSSLKGYSDRNAFVELPGGTLEIKWDEEDFLHMGGEVKSVFSGLLSDELLGELK